MSIYHNKYYNIYKKLHINFFKITKILKANKKFIDFKKTII